MKGKNRKADFVSAFFKCSFQSILLATVFFEKGIFMEIKFKDKMDSYKYLVMFDLASKVTGVCVWNIAKKEPLCTTVIRVKDGTGLPAAELKTRINALFDELDKEIGRENYFVSKEMMPTQIHGGSSTVQTFVALAKSHAILDVCCYEKGIPCYDYKGVAPATTHAYYRRLNGLSPQDKVTKEMVSEYLYDSFSNLLKATTLDETDAVFLAKTLCESKWDKDIEEKIREEKRHRKELKAPHAIAAVDAEIERLNLLKTDLKQENAPIFWGKEEKRCLR